jgi:acyl carrier protein
MNIETQIRRFILQNLYFAEDNSLGDDASFLETGVVDSMGVMELVAFVQSEFGVTVEPQEVVVENFDSISKLTNFVRRKLSLSKRGASLPAAETAPEPDSRASSRSDKILSTQE